VVVDAGVGLRPAIFRGLGVIMIRAPNVVAPLLIDAADLLGVTVV
jgi:hypothetical protein